LKKNNNGKMHNFERSRRPSWRVWNMNDFFCVTKQKKRKTKHI